MKEKRLLWQLYPSYFLIIILSVSLMLFFSTRAFDHFFIRQTTDHLKSQTLLFETQVKPLLHHHQIQSLVLPKALSSRYTLLDPQGAILFDSYESPENMDNHLQRPEIQQALHEEWGVSRRYSDTIQTPMLYVAKAINADGDHVIGIIRSAISINELDVVLNLLKKQIIVWGIIISIFSGVISFVVSKRMTLPIKSLTRGAVRFSRGDFGFRLTSPHVQEFRMLAQALNDMAERLKRLEAMRTEFVANVSHELKTPITLIKGFLETLLSNAVDNPEERDEFLTIIQHHTDRLDTIIEDLLALSRIERGLESLDFMDQDMQDVVKSAIQFCQSKATDKQIQIQYQHSCHVISKINRSLMEQALINLIDNAIKYSPEKSTVTITVAEENGQCRVDVSDEGRGISAEHIPHLFERFYRVDKARSRDLGGTGLGLSIVKHILQEHNGTVSVISELGKGSTFTIRV